MTDIMSDPTASVARDALLRALTDVLTDAAEKTADLPAACQKCPVYNVLSEFATKLKKAGLREEMDIVQAVREHYDI